MSVSPRVWGFRNDAPGTDSASSGLISPRKLIQFLEASLPKSFGDELSQPAGPAFCSTCNSNLTCADGNLRQTWEKKKQNSLYCAAVEDFSSHGFLRHCTICRTSIIIRLPDQFQPGPTERGVIVPSEMSGMSLALRNNVEGEKILLLSS